MLSTAAATALTPTAALPESERVVDLPPFLAPLESDERVTDASATEAVKYLMGKVAATCPKCTKAKGFSGSSGNQYQCKWCKWKFSIHAIFELVIGAIKDGPAGRHNIDRAQLLKHLKGNATAKSTFKDWHRNWLLQHTATSTIIVYSGWVTPAEMTRHNASDAMKGKKYEPKKSSTGITKPTQPTLMESGESWADADPFEQFIPGPSTPVIAIKRVRQESPELDGSSQSQENTEDVTLLKQVIANQQEELEAAASNHQAELAKIRAELTENAAKQREDMAKLMEVVETLLSEKEAQAKIIAELSAICQQMRGTQVQQPLPTGRAEDPGNPMDTAPEPAAAGPPVAPPPVIERMPPSAVGRTPPARRQRIEPSGSVEEGLKALQQMASTEAARRREAWLSAQILEKKIDFNRDFVRQYYDGFSREYSYQDIRVALSKFGVNVSKILNLDFIGRRRLEFIVSADFAEELSKKILLIGAFRQLNGFNPAENRDAFLARLGRRAENSRMPLVNGYFSWWLAEANKEEIADAQMPAPALETDAITAQDDVENSDDLMDVTGGIPQPPVSLPELAEMPAAQQ